LTGRQR